MAESSSRSQNKVCRPKQEISHEMFFLINQKFMVQWKTDSLNHELFLFLSLFLFPIFVRVTTVRNQIESISIG